MSNIQEPTEDNRLGALMIRAGAVSSEDLAAALAHRTPGQKLGECLVEMGFTSLEAVEAALKEQLRDARLGQILLRIDAIRLSDLQAALDAQTRAGRMLGELLIEAGACTAELVDWALAQQSAEKRTAAIFMRRGLIQQASAERAFAALAAQPDRQFTELLVELELVTAEQVRETLRLKLQETRLGSLLLARGAVSLEQLQVALAEQTVTGHMLGQVLIQLGFCDVQAVSAALAEQLLEG